VEKWREHLPQNHLRKLAYIWAGFKDCWGTSSGFRLHLAADVLAFVLAGVFTVSIFAWICLILVCVMKAAIELLNSAIEEVVDELYQMNRNNRAKRIKDFAAAGVFATVVGSFIVWGIVFVPEFIGLIV
jgi:diacylglycerol kinase